VQFGLAQCDLPTGFGGVYYGWGSFERDPNPTLEQQLTELAPAA
jgi:hypothetical protein